MDARNWLKVFWKTVQEKVSLWFELVLINVLDQLYLSFKNFTNKLQPKYKTKIIFTSLNTFDLLLPFDTDAGCNSRWSFAFSLQDNSKKNFRASCRRLFLNFIIITFDFETSSLTFIRNSFKVSFCLTDEIR